MFWLDTTILALIALGAVLGAISGFLWQIARLASLALALYAAILLNDWASDSLRQALLPAADPRIPRALAYVAIFFVVYLVLYQVVWLLDRAVRAVRLEPIDRLLGAAMGGLKIGLVLAGVFLGLSAYPHPLSKEIMDRSALAPVLAEGMEMIVLVIPEEYRTELCAGLATLRDKARAHLDPTRRPEGTPKTPDP
jgi:membrane protein required for colicin V production